MRIVQITDIHISTAVDKPFGIDVRNQFSSVLDRTLQLGPDRIVISGDLCYKEPSDEIYAWIREQLQTVTCPVHVIAGNHDAQKIMHKHFECAYHEDTDEIYYAADNILFLDTARGVMSEDQYHWLASNLSSLTERAVIFMHHPPAFCGVPHMDDSYAFKEIPRLQHLFNSYSLDLEIFCGHYHVERDVLFGNQKIHISPSTFFQLDYTQSEFKIDHSHPGCRVIEIEEEDRIQSSCHYL